jgi:hypothetical protein
MIESFPFPHLVLQAPHPGRRLLQRIALPAMIAISLAAVTTHWATAQDAQAPRPHLELLVSSGRLVPTGNRNDVIQSAGMTTLQLSWVARPTLAITATGGWARSRDLGSSDEPRLDILAYDVGAELRAARPVARGAVSFRPFVGAGAGGRSYDYRHLTVDATHQLAAFGSAGGELGFRRVHVRLELRDYLSGFTPLQGGGPSTTRNDLVVMVGLRYTRQ